MGFRGKRSLIKLMWIRNNGDNYHVHFLASSSQVILGKKKFTTAHQHFIGSFWPILLRFLLNIPPFLSYIRQQSYLAQSFPVSGTVISGIQHSHFRYPAQSFPVSGTVISGIRHSHFRYPAIIFVIRHSHFRYPAEYPAGSRNPARYQVKRYYIFRPA